MLESNLIVLKVAFLLIATLYPITGHGGASNYIAVMALFGVAPQEMKPLDTISATMYRSKIITTTFMSLCITSWD